MVIFLSNTTLTKKINIEPSTHQAKEQPPAPIELSTIYDNDLFGTFNLKQVAPPKQKDDTEPKLPSAPQPVVVSIPPEHPDTFLEPLSITLTGTITLTDDSKNKAIVLDTKTKIQTSFKVGDEIEDAQLIRIFKNKAIFLRSNGQQETIFLDQDDILLHDPEVNWKHIIETVSTTMFLVDPAKFIKKMNNISEFINQMNLTGAFKHGKSIGIKIGAAQKDSIGVALGFHAGDIVTKVNNISASNTEDVYNNILKQKANNNIIVDILRSGESITHTYKLKDVIFPQEKKKHDPKKTDADNEKEIFLDKNKIEKEKLKILRKKYNFAPTAFELKMKEEQNRKKVAGR